MLQDFKLVLFTAAIVSAASSQPGASGYQAAVQMAAAVLRATVRLLSQCWRRSRRDGSRIGWRDARAHSL
jgi:hypothetical protein